MEVYALLYLASGHQGQAATWEAVRFTPPRGANYPVKVEPGGPVVAPAVEVIEHSMRYARERVLARCRRCRTRRPQCQEDGKLAAMGPLLFYVDLPEVAHPLNPPDSLGLSAALLFAAQVCLKAPLARVAATGRVDNGGNVLKVNNIEEKIRAALQVLKEGDLILYPAANDRQISNRLRDEAQGRGVRLVPVNSVAEALDEVLPQAIPQRQARPEPGRRRLVLWAPVLGLAGLALAYWLFFYPWPRPPSLAVTAPALAQETSWQDPGLAAWLERPAEVNGKDALYYVEGTFKLPGRYLIRPGRLRLEATVHTDGGDYPQPPAELRMLPWSAGFRAPVWFDRRLFDARLRLALYSGEKLLAVQEIALRDRPPPPQWSVAVRNGALEVGYRSGEGLRRVAAVRLDSGALSFADGGRGALLYPFAWWENGRLIRGARVLAPFGKPLFRAAADEADPRSLKLRLVLDGADWDITFRPPGDGGAQALWRVRLFRLPPVDSRPIPGEAFQMVHLVPRAAPAYAYVANPAKGLPGDQYREVVAAAGFSAPGYAFGAPREAELLAVVPAGENGPAVEVRLDRRAKVNGTGRDTLALWAGLEKPALSWSGEAVARPGSSTFDAMEAAGGWNLYRDDTGGHEVQVELLSVPGLLGWALAVEYRFVSGEWLGIYKGPADLSRYEGVRFFYYGEGGRNTLEFKLEDLDGTTYGKFVVAKTNPGRWLAVEIPFRDLEFWWDKDGRDTGLDLTNALVNFAISKKEGDEGGQGRVVLDQVELFPAAPAQRRPPAWSGAEAQASWR